MEIIIFIIIFIILLSAGYAAMRAAPFVPTRKDDVERFLALAELKSGEIFYDLGCGDGRLVIAAAEKGATAIGWEISIFNFILSWLKAKINKNCGKIKIKLRDFWFINLKQADCLYVFLMPDVAKKFQKKALKELKNNARIITYVWPLPDLMPEKIDIKDKRPKMYLYRIKK